MGYRIKRFSVEDAFDIERLKDNVISVLAARQIVDLSKGVLEKYGADIPSLRELTSSLEKKKKDNDENYVEKKTNEEFSYEDTPKIRKNSIVIRKPEIRYRKEDTIETPEEFHRSVIEYPEKD